MYQAAVGRAVLPGSGVDAGYPQPALVALAFAAVEVGLPQALQPGLVGAAVELRAGAELTFCEFKDFLMSFPAGEAGLYTWHYLPPASPGASTVLDCQLHTPRGRN